MFKSVTMIAFFGLCFAAVGCAKNTGSLAVNDPFASGDPFQSGSNQSSQGTSSMENPARMTTGEINTAQSTSTPGWSSTRQYATRNTPGMNTSSPAQTMTADKSSTALKFQMSAPVPEIIAEPIPMPLSPISNSRTPADFPTTPQLQQANYINDPSEGGVTPASFETKLPIIKPAGSVEDPQSPVTLDIPVFAEDEAESKFSEKPAVSGETWWAQ